MLIFSNPAICYQHSHSLSSHYSMQLHKGFTHWLYQHHEHNTVKSKEKKRKKKKISGAQEIVIIHNLPTRT